MKSWLLYLLVLSGQSTCANSNSIIRLDGRLIESTNRKLVPRGGSPGLKSGKRRSPTQRPYTADQGPSAVASQPRAVDAVTNQLASSRLTDNSGAVPSAAQSDTPGVRTTNRNKRGSPTSGASSSGGAPNPPQTVSNPLHRPGDIANLGKPGPYWMDKERTRLAEYKAKAAASQGLPVEPPGSGRGTTDAAIAKAESLKAKAQESRRVDNHHLRTYRNNLANGNLNTIQAAKRTSKDASLKAAADTQAHSDALGSAAITAAHYGHYPEAIKQVQLANRAHQRAALRRAHGFGMDLKYVHTISQNDLAKARGTDRERQVKTDTAVYRDHYKDAAKDYHKIYKDYKTVREEFDGSSSDESEKSSFRDIVGSPRGGSSSPR